MEQNNNTYELKLPPDNHWIIKPIDSDVDIFKFSGAWNSSIYGLFWQFNKKIQQNISVLDFSECIVNDDEFILYQNFPELEKIILPTTLNHCSLYIYSQKLRHIIFPEKVKSISLGFDSDLISEIELPETVETLYLGKISGLRTLKIGKNLKKINGDAFANCQDLERLEISTENKYLTLENNVIYDNQTKTIVASFFNKDSMKQITVPYGIESIGEKAFKGSPIEQIFLPETLKTINDHAFESCKSLISIVIPDSVTTIGRDAFNGCTNLQTLRLSNSIKKLDKIIAGDCRNLKQIFLPEQLQFIYPDFFTFVNSTQELQVIISEKNNYYKVIDGIMYSKDLKTLEVVINKNEKAYNIADGVEIIGPEAFCMCHGLEQIDLPDTVIEIQAEAFSSCRNLTRIRFGKNLKSFAVSAIKNDNKIKELIITGPEPPRITGDLIYEYFNYDEDLQHLPIYRVTEEDIRDYWNKFKMISDKNFSMYDLQKKIQEETDKLLQQIPS